MYVYYQRIGHMRSEDRRLLEAKQQQTDRLKLTTEPRTHKNWLWSRAKAHRDNDFGSNDKVRVLDVTCLVC